MVVREAAPAEDRLDEKLAASIAEKLEAVPLQFSADDLTGLLCCRVDTIELEQLAARKTLQRLSKHLAVYEVVDLTWWETWVTAKLVQLDARSKPAPVREPDPVPDPGHVNDVAAAILKALEAVPEADRDLVLKGAIDQVRSDKPAPVPEPPPEVVEPAPVVRTR